MKRTINKDKDLVGTVLQENETHVLLLLPGGSKIVYDKSGIKNFKTQTK